MGVLPRSDQKKVFLVTFVQISLGALDLLGVIAIGVLGALSAAGLQSQTPGSRIETLLRVFHLSNEPFQTQATVIGSAAVILLVGRTILSIYFTRRMLFFLSRRGAVISATLVSRLLSQPLLVVQSRTSQETLYAITAGVNIITLQILATGVVMASDISLLLVMGIGLFAVDPSTAFGTFLMFGAIAYFLYQFMHVRAEKLGLESTLLSIKSSEKIVEVFASYRELVVRNRRDYYARKIGKLRFELANTLAEQNFMPYISKYVIETAVVVGALIIGAAQFVLHDATHAVATLAIFLAAGTRIAPAVLRVQQGAITIKNGVGGATQTLNLIDVLGNSPLIENVDDSVDTVHEGFNSEIRVKGAGLTYPGKLVPAIPDINLLIPSGASVALVGPSGAGKTTIIDVILGVLYADEGGVLISGMPPHFAITKWPGAISYVPQDVVITRGTIRENVALGFPREAATDDLVMSALKVAHLDKFVADLPNGVDTEIGERGTDISGGQRQRLGIARAMFTKPHILVLDEATSSLDGETEASISRAIQALRGSTTVVMIAHRLSTVRNVDILVYLAEGKIIAKGTFEEVRNAVPDFDRQAKLMGL